MSLMRQFLVDKKKIYYADVASTVPPVNSENFVQIVDLRQQYKLLQVETYCWSTTCICYQVCTYSHVVVWHLQYA